MNETQAAIALLQAAQINVRNTWTTKRDMWAITLLAHAIRHLDIAGGWGIK